MGKKYCDVGHKWCKLCQKGICKANNVNTAVENLTKCPRIEAIETITLYQLIREVKFEDAFERLCYYFPDQKKSREGYEKAFNELLKKKLHKSHNLNDLFIHVVKDEYEGKEYLDVCGKKLHSDMRYGIEFCKWSEWVSMFIANETLNSLSREDIVAGCLWEMTFDGFSEKTVMEHKNKLFNSIEEMKKENKEKNENI